MRLVSEHLPEREGTATGRLLRATVEGLLAEGQQVSVVCWTDRSPREELPCWVDHRPLSRSHSARDHAAALLRPRWAAAALDLTGDDLTVAEEPLSFAAVARLPRSAVVLHYSCLLDARALGRVRPADLQGHRADRRAARRAGTVLSYSPRVAAALGGTFVPAAVALADPLPLVEQPHALLLAGWDWAPNLAALATLVRSVDPSRLVIAGRGSPDVPGALVLGEVPTAREAFARAAALAFPCPPSSGPKVKVLEALAAGLPVVTTPAGVEGLTPAAAAACRVAPVAGFAAALDEVLADPDLRARMATAGRAAVAEGHAPRVAARARLTALG